MSEVVLKIENISKKFCKSLKKSMFYGIKDIFHTTVGILPASEKLREGEFWAIDNASFELKKGQTLGIIGKNGSGKSTMLKMLNGIFMPDKGRIEVVGRVGALIEVGAGFHPLLSGRENIYINGSILGMSKKEIDAKYDDIVNFADIGDFIDAPVKHYSSGMFVRLGFAVAIHCEPDVLLVDEVLAVGDIGFQSKCFNKIGEIKKRGAAIVLVSHNMHSISTFSDRVLFLNSGKHKWFDSVSEGVSEYKKIFISEDDLGIQKIVTGNDHIEFKHVKIEKQKLNPRDSFRISMDYDSKKEYKNAEVDLAVFTNKQQGIYFQATNKTFNKEIKLKLGAGRLNFVINEIPINNDNAMVAMAIWSEGRKEKLFWWRVNIVFNDVLGSTGNNFLNVDYEVS
jgi:lipopolysaccharide transport system ATP-binding protein